MGDWDEDAHPRDEQGRFGASGGSSGRALKDWASGSARGGGGDKSFSGKALQAYAGKTSEAPQAHEPAKGADGIDLGKGERTWTDKPPAGMKPETWQAHFSGHPEKGGQPNAERKVLHDEIVKEALARAEPAKPGEQKVAIMTMGGPASGKTSMLRGIDDSKFVKVDPDDIKGKLPEYQQATHPDATFRGAAAMAHEESSFLAKRVRDEAIDRGNHVIIDGTGANAEKFLATYQMLKDKGYEVQVHMPHLSVEEGVSRALARAEKTGRYVPKEFIQKAYENINANAERIMAKVDNFHLYDASTKGHPKTLTKEGGDSGRTVVHNQAAFKAFQERPK